jgi:hypothetical protein
MYNFAVNNLHPLHQLLLHPGISFEQKALEIFSYQAKNCKIYQQYLVALQINVDAITKTSQIPFLPIQFFKTHTVTDGTNTSLVFKSSGTTANTTAKHFVANPTLYLQNCELGYETFYPKIEETAILGLLPSYVENGDSSLVYMVEHFIKKSKQPQSGIYLYEPKQLIELLISLKKSQTPTLLIGVTYALLQLAQAFKIELGKNCIIMETGGMKGRGKELTREQVHQQLKDSFGTQFIASEYGMTELLSQAYSPANGIFTCSPSMQVSIRDVHDPLSNAAIGKGCINIIDLANIHSCSFIATQDVGEVFADGTFTIQGRLDSADVRGCNLLVV